MTDGTYVMTKDNAADKHTCSFCGAVTDKIIIKKGAAICNHCVKAAYEALDSYQQSQNSWFTPTIPNPSEIKSRLDEHVIGQDHAKRALAVAVYNHYKRIESNFEDPELNLKKSNVL